MCAIPQLLCLCKRLVAVIEGDIRKVDGDRIHVRERPPLIRYGILSEGANGAWKGEQELPSPLIFIDFFKQLLVQFRTIH